MTDDEYQIRRKYENRNLMQELQWVSHYPPSGMSDQDKDFIRWLAMTAYDRIEELSKQHEAQRNNLIALLNDKPRWIPVTERLPEEKINPNTRDFEPIICSTNFGDVRVYKYGTPIGWNEPHFWNGASIMDWYVTHWMPLPEPQEEGE